jgi:GTP-binding protein HflX
MIGASDVMQIEVYNKIDNHVEQKHRLEISDNGAKTRIWLSSRTGEGVNLLLETIIKHLGQFRKSRFINLPLSAGQLRAKLFDIGAVKQENIDDMGGWVMRVELEEYKLHKLCKEANLDMSNITVEGCSLLTSI